ncbi:40671_t:CDS:2, partial [Gigaspora margarita]
MRKVKCSGMTPCSNCNYTGKECIFTPQIKRGPKKHDRSFNDMRKVAVNTDRFRSPYISTACLPCAQVKVKCSGGIPCDRCISKKHECTSNPFSAKNKKIAELFDFSDRNKVADESIANLESPLICSLCGKSGKFQNNYYQCETCINEFGLGSSGNQIIDLFLKSKGDQFQWIPYNCFQDIKYLSKGGFGIVYKARWKHIEVVLKSLYNSDNINIDFLKEVDSHKKFKNYNGVVQIYGITRDPFKKNYLMVTKYVS